MRLDITEARETSLTSVKFKVIMIITIIIVKIVENNKKQLIEAMEIMITTNDRDMKSGNENNTENCNNHRKIKLIIE